MARRNAGNAVSASEAHVGLLKCYLRESEIILRALETQKNKAGETFIHEKRLSEAQREHIQLKNELSLASEKHARLTLKKDVLLSARQ